MASLSIIKTFWRSKWWSDEVTDFYDKKIPMVDSSHTYLVVISLVFLKECKNKNEKKVVKHINDNLSDFSSHDELDKE